MVRCRAILDRRHELRVSGHGLRVVQVPAIEPLVTRNSELGTRNRRVHMPAKECPLCGELMRLVEREILDRVPGTSEVKRHKTSEWVCPECDHFEEADAGGAP